MNYENSGPMTELEHSISRLTAWLRDYGGTRTEVFRGDLHSVLDASRRYHPALRKLIAISEHVDGLDDDTAKAIRIILGREE